MKFRMKIRSNADLEYLGPLPAGLYPNDEKPERFSEIVPALPWQGRAFRILRWIFGDNGRVADWTRTWKCVWECTILRGYNRGARNVSRNRAELLAWEDDVWWGNAIGLHPGKEHKRGSH